MALVLDRFEAALLGQRGYLFPWAPVALACGIGGYFSLLAEPPMLVLLALVGFGVLGVFGLRIAGAVWGPVVTGAALMVMGFGLAGLRAHHVAGPVLDFRYYGAVEGRIIGIDRSASDAVRLTLDHVVLERMDPRKTPHRVRVSLHGAQGFAELKPGATVILTGHLSQPGGAVEPGGFDFRRHAWFLELGAVGYTRNPVLLLEPPGGGLSVFKARMWLSSRVQAQMPGESGAFAAAVMSGDRSGMGQGNLQDLRDTNLAHLLAISGLHMGLLAGFVFAALRLALLIIPATRHRWPVKKIAAAGALIAAFGYLLLSGGNVATERAFIMVATALCALMLDRRAISLRAVAMAALIVLIWQPEALLGPGFQMSFAATTALVAVFEQITAIQRDRPLPRWVLPFMSLVVSSAVAGLATAPVGMAHFNQIAHYGLIANLISVPVMGALVVPMAVVAALLMPLGLDWIPLWLVGVGLDWILFVAASVAEWEGATSSVVAPNWMVLPLLAFGALILCLWRGVGRLAGLAPMALALLLWWQTERPALLVADTGALVGVMTPEGRALSKAKGAGFVAGIWLENDGHGLDQPRAATLWPEPATKRVARVQMGTTEVVHLQGKTVLKGWQECRTGQIIITSAVASLPGGCVVLDPDTLRALGSVAFMLDEGGLRMVSALSLTGDRLWAPAPPSLPLADQREAAARLLANRVVD